MQNFNTIHQSFKLNGIHYDTESLTQLAKRFIDSEEDYKVAMGHFIIDVLDEKPYVVVKTSGSTGQPKSIKLPKSTLINSALATGAYFKLEAGSKALHCLPSHYIAGKMMLVRALVLGWELDCIKPSSKPVFDTSKKYDFCALVPLQLRHCISQIDAIKTVIIGGSKIPSDLLEQIKGVSSNIHETYGMTETATHIALRQLATKHHNGDSCFKALPNVSFNKDERNCLVINASQLLNTDITTNDVVELQSSTEFTLMGRYDNVINSGGVKLHPEHIESKLQTFIKSRFFISSLPDAILGEQLILIIESIYTNAVSIEDLKSFSVLDTFEVPKKVFTTPKFIETSSGKVQRKATLKLVLDTLTH